jgi:hypothetical protein
MFYAQYNAYGSESDIGFVNTCMLASFDTRAARDAWVGQNYDRADVYAVTRATALKISGNRSAYLRGHRAYLADIHFLTDDNKTFVRAW